MTAPQPEPRCATCHEAHPPGCAYRGRLVLEASCPRCGGDLTVVNQGPGGRSTVVIVECLDCGRQQDLSMRLTDHDKTVRTDAQKRAEHAWHTERDTDIKRAQRAKQKETA